jgi:CO/xanthine dehydrogenase Mo-binding subunit
MTGFLHEKEFSRKSFLKGTGAAVAGISAVGALAGNASAAAPGPGGYLPDTTLLDSWISVGTDNTVNLKMSQIEVGNGITTGFLQVLAEEMDLDYTQVKYGQAHYDSAGHNFQTTVDTWIVASTGGEGGSNAMSGQGPKIRAAAAQARGIMLGMAATQLSVPVGSLTVSKGVISGGGKTITYGQLMGGKQFGVTVNPASLQPGVAPAKPIANYSTVTKTGQWPRKDIPAKVTGQYTYVHNIRVPGMLHGRVVRPRGQGAYPYNSNVAISVDAKSIAHIPGAQVVRVGNFLGVVAPKEYDAIQAAQQLKVVYNDNPILATDANLWKQYRAWDAAGKVPTRYGSVTGDVDKALAGAAKVVSGSFAHHYQGHMPIGPACCVADVQADHATILSNTQNVENLVTDLTNVLAPLQAKQIRVIFYEGSGSFGNGAVMFDTAQAASIMSKAVGKPVRVQFMRWDEQGWTHYAPASLVDVRGGIDAKGNIVAYDWTQWTQGGGGIYTSRELLGAGPGSPSPTANTIPTSIAGGSANTENTSPWMTVKTAGAYRLVSKPFPSEGGIFQTGAVRAPGAQQATIADAQIIDMMAVAAGMDSLAFRLQNINPDPNGAENGDRWIGVLQAAAQAAGWKPWVSGSGAAQKTGNIVRGRGIANSHHGGSFASSVADIEVNKKTGKIRVLHVYAAQDAGLTVNPDLVENQMLGSTVQGVSRALTEQVRFNKSYVTSTDWVTYGHLRFVDSPGFTAVVVQRTDKPSLGSGEPPTCPIIGAIANAFYDATGVRLHEAPFTPARVRATLAAAAAGKPIVRKSSPGGTLIAMRPRRWHLAVALVVGLLATASAAQSRVAAPLILKVDFATNGTITVSLPSGTPVGTTSGSPTVIPAGYYVVQMSGPGGCTAMPHFSLRGPGTQIFDNLNEGESDYVEYNANLAPSSTYVWSSDAVPGVVHTFVTSSDVVGTAPPKSPGGLTSSNHTTVKSSDLVGANILKFQGTIVGDVSAGGKVTLAFNGKNVANLKAGRYTVKVTDKSSKNGVMFQKASHSVLTAVTGPMFVGKRSAEVKLTAGTWLVVPRPGHTAYTIKVS